MKRLRLNTWCFLCFVMNKIWVYVIWQSQFLFIFSTTSQLFWNQSTNHGSYATSLFVVIFTNKTFSSLTLVFSFSLTHRRGIMKHFSVFKTRWSSNIHIFTEHQDKNCKHLTRVKVSCYTWSAPYLFFSKHWKCKH